MSLAAARIAAKSVKWLIRFNACITFHSSKTHSEYNRIERNSGLSMYVLYGDVMEYIIIYI